MDNRKEHLFGVTTGACVAAADEFSSMKDMPRAIVLLPIYADGNKVYFGTNNQGIPFKECPCYTKEK